MSTPIVPLKDRLKKAMDLRNLKPIDLVEKTKISKSAISQYMSRYTKPKARQSIFISTSIKCKWGMAVRI